MSTLVPIDAKTAKVKTKLTGTNATTIYTGLANGKSKLLWMRMVNNHASNPCDVTVTIETTGGTIHTWLPATEIAAKASRTEDFDAFKLDEGDLLKVTAELANQIEVFAVIAEIHGTIGKVGQ
jgi:hypothetical protein